MSASGTAASRNPAVAIMLPRKRPSRLTLPVVPGVDVPTELPPCPGLRGQPCRDFKPAG